METIIYLEENGESQVVTEITNIAHMAIAGDSNAKQLARYIRQGLQQLSNVGIPYDKRLIMIGEEENGDLRTFQLLKDLKYCKYPLFEFRVNRSTPGAFRAIFFEYVYEGEQLLIFTKAVLKKGDPNPLSSKQRLKRVKSYMKNFMRIQTNI